MPSVNIQITKGATKEQKAHLVRDVTESLVRELGKKPEHIHVIIQEIEEEDWDFAGLLTDEWKKQLHIPPIDSTRTAVPMHRDQGMLRVLANSQFRQHCLRKVGQP